MARFNSRLVAQFICCAALCSSVALGDTGNDDADLATARAEAMKTYQRAVAPFMTTYCIRCHSGKKQKGGVTFQGALKSPGLASSRTLWKRASNQIKAKDMPPEEADAQPSEQERKAVVEWIAGIKRLSPKDPGQFVIRRLSRAEYGNTLHDLFGVDPQIAHDLPDEVFGAGYTNSLSPLLMEQYLAIANEVLNLVLAPPGAAPTAMQQRLFGADPGDPAGRKAAARKIAHSLARLAYRRPPSEAEVDVLLRVFALAADQGKSYPQSLRLMLKAILVSPQFLFITPGAGDKTGDEAGNTNAAGDIVALDDYQLASRLSYLLWGTMPDAQLSALADAGKLHDPPVLAAQARRLIADPRSRALFDGFGAQWLGLDKLAGKTFDGSKFPQMTGDLRTSMYDEARLLFESILRDNRSLATFIDSDYTFLNSNLASIYGMQSTVTGPQMRKVKLSDANRGGILTMPGILAMSSFPNRTSPVNRGVWVLEQVLGEHVPPPPPDVPSLEKQDQQKVANLTLRQRTELHRSNPVCANCHKVFDPIGYGLENFDAIGRWRDRDDSGGAIDATGELPGAHRFGTPRELKRIIAGRTDDFSRNLAGKLLAYALCRQLDGYDEVVVDKLSGAIAEDGYRMQTLVVGVVTSYPFTHRRVSNQITEGPKTK
jgi:mono/diheme cytochrome c family protein